METSIQNILSDYVLTIYNKDQNFKDFLFKRQIQKEELLGALNWIISRKNREKRNERFWSREKLTVGKGIGDEWSYGETYTIEKYGDKIENIYNFETAYISKESKEKVTQIENILEKNSQRNVLLVGDNQVLNINIVEYLGKKILKGEVLKNLLDKNIFVIDTDVLVSSTKNKADFENELFSILNQSIKAGNVILFIPNLPVFINNAKNLGSDITSLIEPYITNTNIQIIATSPLGTFHQIIEKDNILMTGFEKIIINEEGYSSLMEILLQEADDLEKEYRVIFTYQSIETLAKDSIRFFVGELIIDKTVDILQELPLIAIKNGENIITKTMVEKIISQKTSVPTGQIDEKEKEKILNIEDNLHRYIVGQDEAVNAISNTIKRLRAEVNTTNRPIGSFLFLGPTGVGKTETVKTLNKVFFGENGNIIRLDMSEYHGEEGLEKLIGSFKTNTDGHLVNKLRENQYGILLLDEFEKASSDVLNLFLQILDEGIFSDMNGKKVNARNMIIVATSNAGSELIWELSQKGEDLNSNKDKIISSIVENNIFKPELVNRFDSVILFHSLTKEHLKEISKIAIEKLKIDMRAKGFDINFTEDVLDFLVEKGSDPKFGARPLRRTIQDVIEKSIAEKIIKGEIKAGDSFTFSKKDIY
jgi:ATP-dependent Clp protease ATP-binding subunit ClpA